MDVLAEIEVGPDEIRLSSAPVNAKPVSGPARVTQEFWCSAVLVMLEGTALTFGKLPNRKVPKQLTWLAAWEKQALVMRNAKLPNPHLIPY